MHSLLVLLYAKAKAKEVPKRKSVDFCDLAGLEERGNPGVQSLARKVIPVGNSSRGRGETARLDYANRRRGDHSAFEAIHQAGLRRFRPIILTTATTFGGLTPIILETSPQSYYLIPMAISLGFGIVFATSIILVLVPCLYLILEDVVGKIAPQRATTG